MAFQRDIQADQANLIVITQTCDLEHGKVSLIALCPVWSIAAFEEAQASHGRSKSGRAWQDYWNNVRKGRSPTRTEEIESRHRKVWKEVLLNRQFGLNFPLAAERFKALFGGG